MGATLRMAQMTFLAYLAAQGDANCQALHRDLSGLADGANDLGVVVAYLRSTLGGSEAVLAVEEAAYRWREWRKIEDRTQRESFVEGHFLKIFAVGIAFREIRCDIG